MKEPRARAVAMPADPAVDQPPADSAALSPIEGDPDPDPEPGSAPLPAAFDRDGDGDPGGSPPLQPYAVLLADHATFAAGVVVFGPPAAIAALVEGETARFATETDIALAGVHVRALPET